MILFINWFIIKKGDTEPGLELKVPTGHGLQAINEVELN